MNRTATIITVSSLLTLLASPLAHAYKGPEEAFESDSAQGEAIILQEEPAPEEAPPPAEDDPMGFSDEAMDPPADWSDSPEDPWANQEYQESDSVPQEYTGETSGEMEFDPFSSEGDVSPSTGEEYEIPYEGETPVLEFTEPSVEEQQQMEVAPPAITEELTNEVPHAAAVEGNSTKMLMLAFIGVMILGVGVFALRAMRIFSSHPAAAVVAAPEVLMPVAPPVEPVIPQQAPPTEPPSVV
ncbi:MAG: hypothetical protein Q7R81_00260 [Candidatus Peregrinibacteria bacterium]|nr:hypothetical protein [Candidatus Peregrinibacteria bacterium]